MRILLLALILVTAALAGCADNDDPSAADVDAASADVSAGGASASAGPGSASASSGGANATAAGGAAEASAADDAAAEPPATREVVIAESGAFAGGAEVCQTSGSGVSCTGNGDVRDAFEIDLGGGVATAFGFELTWAAETPATSELSMSVYACDHDGCDIFDLAGPSGLTSMQTGSAWTSLMVAVSAAPRGTGGVGVYVAPPEEFSLGGSVTVVGP
jgi:hypothetical protein